MELDWELIRKIMFDAQKGDKYQKEYHLPPYDDSLVNAQIYFLAQAKMIEAWTNYDESHDKVLSAYIKSILSLGQEFLFLTKDDKNWKTVMDYFTDSHQQPVFETLVHALKHIDEILYLKEQRALVAKQDKYTEAIKRATNATAIATWLMAIAILVQIALPFIVHGCAPQTPTTQTLSIQKPDTTRK